MKKVLIIDDDLDEFELIKDSFAKLDTAIEVEHNTNCDELINNQSTNYDLVLLDINMPLRDGFSCLQEIRKKKSHSLFITIYSNSGSPQHIRKSYLEGANLYFQKPDSFTKLTDLLRRLLKLDWSKPMEITNQYLINDVYYSFDQVEHNL